MPGVSHLPWAHSRSDLAGVDGKFFSHQLQCPINISSSDRSDYALCRGNGSADSSTNFSVLTSRIYPHSRVCHNIKPTVGAYFHLVSTTPLNLCHRYVANTALTGREGQFLRVREPSHTRNFEPNFCEQSMFYLLFATGWSADLILTGITCVWLHRARTGLHRYARRTIILP